MTILFFFIFMAAVEFSLTLINKHFQGAANFCSNASPLTAWIILFFAGLTEVLWVFFLKECEGFSKIWPTFWVVITGGVSFYLLSLAIKTLPLGTSYAIWTGIGAVGTILVGIFVFQESADFLRLFFLSLILLGIVGLKMHTC